MSRWLLLVFAISFVSCVDPVGTPPDGPLGVPIITAGLPVEARVLVLSGSGGEPELGAIRSVLDHRGVPYDVFVAANEPALDATRLRVGERGLYQATVVVDSRIAMGNTEWAALADYEQHFGIRRAVLTAAPDGALGWSGSATRDTSASPLAVRCTTDGEDVFRDVRCDLTQTIAGGTAYLSTATGALTPLLTDGSGHALAAIHTGADGRETLIMLFHHTAARVHSQLFLHGVLDWVTGGTYLGERQLHLGVQVDDVLLGTVDYPGNYRLTVADFRAALAWVNERRGQPITPDFHVAFAFNGFTAEDGDPITEEVRAQSPEWWWINHTFTHHHLDAADYATTREELEANIEIADALPLANFDRRNFVPPNISGLVNPEAMQAAYDAGIRYAITDTSMPGCENPSPNTTFYNALQPEILFVPRHATNLFYDVSTPAEWTAKWAAEFDDTLSYAEIIDAESDTLLAYLLRGDADPWMFHRANLRAYDGVHSMLGDLIDAVLAKLEVLVAVPVLTPKMEDEAARFERRVAAEAAGVRATLYPGRALVIDAGRSVDVPVTHDDEITLVTVTPGTSACLPLDAAGEGCSPSPGREGGAGSVRALPTGYCDGTGTGDKPPMSTVLAIPRKAEWRYWDRGGDLGTTWRARTFDDSAWARGAGPLGYGETYLGTTVSYGSSSSSKYITTYARRQFSVDDPAAVTAIRAEVMYDDGVVVYLNGSEVARRAMPTGTITATTRANDHEANNAYDVIDGTAWRGLLVAGTNTIAVEVHQTSSSSSDLAFDLSLAIDTGTPPPPPPPQPPPSGGVARGSSWHYWDRGGDLGTSWRTQSNTWPTGAGPLGYGESYLATTISYGPSSSSKYTTTYFTTTFTVDDPAAVGRLLGEVMYDDGFVAYLNGVELGRAAMPTGTVTAATRSTGHEAGNAYQTFDWTARRDALRAGTNTLAVEVHQADASSSDLVFDLALAVELGEPPPPPPPPPPSGGFARGSTWQYWDRGGDLGTAWRTQSNTWPSGAGPLGYGESFLATTVSYGPSSSSKYITTYFTRAFTVDDPAAITALIAEVMYDDGFVAYVNGVEIGRASMPSGAVTAATRATDHDANGYDTFDWTGGRGLLVPGTNILAVEVHQAWTTSSDLVFDLALTAR